MNRNVFESKKLGGDKCWYCGVRLFPGTKLSDHFWPKYLGGKLKISCCKNCNSLKGSLTPLGFIEILRFKQSKETDSNKCQLYSRMIIATQTLWELTKIDTEDFKIYH